LARGDRSRQERTAADRERDRLERANRRAQRERLAPDGLPVAPAEVAGAPDAAPTATEADPLPAEPDAALGPAGAGGEPPHELTGEELAAMALPLPDDETIAPPQGDPLRAHHAVPPPADLDTLRPDEDQPALAALDSDTESFVVLGPDAGEASSDGPPDAPLDASSDGPPDAPVDADAPATRPALPPGPSRQAGSRLPPPPGLGAGAGARRRRSTGRSLPARVIAVLGLVVVVVAIVLVVRSLTKSKPTHHIAGPAVVKVLIPEGKTRLQIAQIARSEGLEGSYRAASRSSPLLDPRHYGAPAGTPDLEGFLFPATYDEYHGAPVSRLVADQLTAFQENFGSELSARASALHVTPYQLLIVASMVEREAQVPGDRAKIAAVIYNRLQREMPLGIDATIYYAIELARNIPTYTHELTEAELHINSPYNTRTHVGLPPTPISNPGVASIQAAAHPAHVSYLYYVAGADGCGEQVFTNTQAEFEVDAAAYDAAVRSNGGHPPTCKKKK